MLNRHQRPTHHWERHIEQDCLHKWVIDRDNKDLAGILELVAADVARDMSGRARRAY